MVMIIERGNSTRHYVIIRHVSFFNTKIEQDLLCHGYLTSDITDDVESLKLIQDFYNSVSC